MKSTYVYFLLGLFFFVGVVVICLDSKFPTYGEATIISASLAGRDMKTGEPFEPCDLVAATKDKDNLYRWARVEHIPTGGVVYVRIMDLMDKDAQADIDLSPAAFQKLGLPLSVGRADVRIRLQ